MAGSTDGFMKSSGPVDRRIVLGIFGVVILAIVVGAFSSCGGRDDKAYQDGRSMASQAELILRAWEGMEDVPDTPREACEHVFDTDERVQGMDRGDWLQGCTDQIRDHPGASPFDLDGPPMTSTAAAQPSRPVYTPSPTRVPPTPESEMSPTSRAILAARVGDCIQHILGEPKGDGTYAVYVYSAECDVPLATHRVSSVEFGTEPTCPGLWTSSIAVRPPKVLCLQPLR